MLKSKKLWEKLKEWKSSFQKKYVADALRLPSQILSETIYQVSCPTVCQVTSGTCPQKGKMRLFSWQLHVYHQMCEIING